VRRTDLNAPHLAENRKVGGSIPSLPTRFAQLGEPRLGTSPAEIRPGLRGIVEASSPAGERDAQKP